MAKITFIGAGSTVFVRNVIGDCICSSYLKGSSIALYDIDKQRLEESKKILDAINNALGNTIHINTYLGREDRKEALRNADFVINAIQVGGYDPCTITDFEIPKKYGLRQTIADTMGIGGIMRGLRTIPVLEEIIADMEAVCPKALFLNYTNPMGIITGYLQRYTSIKTIGLCHSVQACTEELLKKLKMEDRIPGRKELIAGINHMGWLLKITDKDGNDLYPEIKQKAKEMNQNEKHSDMVRFDYIDKLGYYCTESSEHNAEYSPFYIKSQSPELIEKFNIPLDEYPKRCVELIKEWKEEYNTLVSKDKIPHQRGHEYASYIIESCISGKPYKIGANVINTGHLISNLPANACVEVPCIVDGNGVIPCYVGELPVHLAAMNMTNINVQLLTIEAARTKKRESVYHAAMLDPHMAAELSIDNIIKMCDELLDAHGNWMNMYKA